MKKDIKILEEHINYLKRQHFDNGLCDKYYKALENLIKGYRELEYENKYLKEHIAMLICLEQENIDLNNELNKLKSKIKEKIAELEHEKFKKAYLGLFSENNCENRILLAKIQVLQELMEVK